MLDRSECFQPHPPINLSNQASHDEWLRLIRDEEDVIALPPPETWLEYCARLNAKLKPGDLVWINFRDVHRPAYGKNDRPDLIRIDRVRLGTKADARNGWHERAYKGWNHRGEVKEKECVGIMGVDVSWPYGVRHGYETKDRFGSGYHGRYGEWKVDRTLHQWIPFVSAGEWNEPVVSVFNLDAYEKGDFKKFLCERSLKGEYLKFARQLLRWEDYRLGRLKNIPDKK